jgi:hypothetical protein
VVITARRFKTSDYLGMLPGRPPELDSCPPGKLRAARLPHLRVLIHLGDTDEPGFLPFDAVQGAGGSAEYAQLQELAVTLQPDDPINIQFAPGTTLFAAHSAIDGRSVAEGSIFSVSGIDPAQLPCAMNSLLLGGHVRVGLEDNLYYGPGELTTNQRLTECVVRLVREMGYGPATAAEARQILGLPRKGGKRPDFSIG